MKAATPRTAVGQRARILLSGAALLLCGAGAYAGTPAVPCSPGTAPASLEAGDLGPAPAGNFTELCFSVVNDQPRNRDEIAYSSLALPVGSGLTDTGRLAVTAGGRLVAAQFSVLSRWGGPLADDTLPIRWLQVSLPTQPASGAQADFQLRIYDQAPVTPDPLAVTLTEDNGRWQIDTGVARFSVDPDDPALLREFRAVAAGGAEVLLVRAAPEAGPRLVFLNDQDQPVALGAQPFTAAPAPGELFADGFEERSGGGPGQPSVAAAVVDPGSFEIVEAGPVRVTVAARGHFVDPAGSSLCRPGNTAPYESLGYSVAMSFFRNRRDVALEFEFRNECSDAQSGPWTDQTRRVSEVSWQFPLATAGAQTASFGNGLNLGSGAASVAQLRGDFNGGSWQRRATISRNGATVTEAAFFDRPLVAQVSNDWLLGLTAAWLRFREPQALEVTIGGIRFNAVHGDLTVGEGKGIWNHALLTARARSAEPLDAQLGALRLRQLDFLERGLLPRLRLDQLNAAGLFPSLGTEATSAIKTEYLAWMNLLHDETVAPGGQHERNATFGSQLWPDTGSSDPFNVDAGAPNNVSSGMNYWDPAGNELLEYLRSGEPRWAWDFALAGYRTQLHAAYLNTGNASHGNRAGLAVTSGGPGCELFQPPCATDGSGGGQWHRSAFGSDDYSYAMSAELGYALRPTLGLRERFAQAGRTVVGRYDPAIPEGNREAFVNAINITRQVIQHLEMLANCAEFVPGSDGVSCDLRLREIVGELARDNLAAGILCQGEVNFGSGLNGDIPGPPAALPDRCFTPQQFMQNALMLPFFHRYHSNYGDPPQGSIARALSQAPRVLYDQGLAQNPGGALDTAGDWAAALDCQLSADGRSVVACQASPDSDLMTAMSAHTKPHTAAMLLLGHEVDPGVDLCGVARAALDTPGFGGLPTDANAGWNGVGHFNQAGWWKGSSQMMQSMIFAVGIYDTCP